MLECASTSFLLDKHNRTNYNTEYMNMHSDNGSQSTKTISVLEPKTAAQLAELFRALSDPTRLRIISVLVDGEFNVGVLAQAAGISESAASHQLRGLRQMRLVRARKEGRQVYYCLDDEHIHDLYTMGLDHITHS
jgi:ArsR family transcriptional regulator